MSVLSGGMVVVLSVFQHEFYTPYFLLCIVHILLTFGDENFPRDFLTENRLSLWTEIWTL